MANPVKPGVQLNLMDLVGNMAKKRMPKTNKTELPKNPIKIGGKGNKYV